MRNGLAFVVLGLLNFGATWAGGQTLNLVVNSTLDQPDDFIDGVCDTSPIFGSDICTLRGALMEANENFGGVTNISFNINDPGCLGGICVIQVDFTNLGSLPDITQRVNIDGSTQPGNAGTCGLSIGSRPDYRVVLQGESSDIGLRLEDGSDGSVIRGLNIRNFFNNLAIINSMNNRIECNFIGTDETGLVSSGMNVANGIVVGCESNNTIIGGPQPGDGNVISGHAFDGIQYFADFVCPTATNLPSNNAILGNYIGVGADGTASVGNGFSGISFFAGATFGHSIGSLQDGSTMNPNIIGNNGTGIFIADGSNNISIKGNLIGSDISGQADLGNLFGGVEIFEAGDNQVGGNLPGEANVIANNENGVLVTGDAAIGNAVRGNDFMDNVLQAFELIADGSFNSDGLNPNDVDDVDTGANQLMNHPEILSSSLIDLSGDLFVEVEFAVDASQVNATYPIEIGAFYNDNSEFENKAIFSGSQTYVLPQQTTMAVFDIPDGSLGGLISLTATDADGNSSELSAPFVVGFVDLIFENGFE